MHWPLADCPFAPGEEASCILSPAQGSRGPLASPTPGCLSLHTRDHRVQQKQRPQLPVLSGPMPSSAPRHNWVSSILGESGQRVLSPCASIFFPVEELTRLGGSFCFKETREYTFQGLTASIHRSLPEWPWPGCCQGLSVSQVL